MVPDGTPLKVRVLQQQPLRKLHKTIARVRQRHAAVVVRERRLLPPPLNQKGFPVVRNVAMKV